MEVLAMALRRAAIYAARKQEEDGIATVMTICPNGITIACTTKIGDKGICHERHTIHWEAFFWMDHEQRIIEVIDTLHKKINPPLKVLAA